MILERELSDIIRYYIDGLQEIYDFTKSVVEFIKSSNLN